MGEIKTRKSEKKKISAEKEKKKDAGESFRTADGRRGIERFPGGASSPVWNRWEKK